MFRMIASRVAGRELRTYGDLPQGQNQFEILPWQGGFDVWEVGKTYPTGIQGDYMHCVRELNQIVQLRLQDTHYGA